MQQAHDGASRGAEVSLALGERRLVFPFGNPRHFLTTPKGGVTGLGNRILEQGAETFTFSTKD